MKYTRRSKTLSQTRISKRERERLAAVTYPHCKRPRTRIDCEDVPRPCPYAGCIYHLYLDVTPRGSLLLNHPDLEPWELTESCALDVADRGPHTLEEIGEILNVSRERVRQIEAFIFRQLKRSETIQQWWNELFFFDREA